MKNSVKNPTYGWRSAALFASTTAVFEATNHGTKRMAAAARHGARPAWNPPIT